MHGNQNRSAARSEPLTTVYRSRTRITKEGSKIEAGPEILVGKRERRTRKMRWEQLDEDIEYAAKELDRQS
jgi:type I restriction enzyme R subunit